MSVQPQVLYSLVVTKVSGAPQCIGACTLREAQVAAEAISMLTSVLRVDITVLRSGTVPYAYSGGRQIEGRFVSVHVPRFVHPS